MVREYAEKLTLVLVHIHYSGFDFELIGIEIDSLSEVKSPRSSGGSKSSKSDSVSLSSSIVTTVIPSSVGEGGDADSITDGAGAGAETEVIVNLVFLSNVKNGIISS